MSGILAEAESRLDRDEARADELAARRWQKGLQRTRTGEAKGTLANVVHAMESAPELAGIVALDKFTLRTILTKRPPWEAAPFTPRPWRDSDDGELLTWLQRADVPAQATATIADAVRVVAERHSFDALADYLNGLQWDGVERLSYWLTLYLDAADTPLIGAMGRAWLISAVARGLAPGCQADHALVLESGQGNGKTQTARTLGGEWTQEHLPDFHSKDAATALAGAWIVELSELAAMSKSEAEAVKSFLTRRIDKYRPPYGRHLIEQARRCVFLGTTNESSYLRDATGNRRFWPVEIGTANIEALARDRDQLIAEAVDAYRAGEAWYLTDAELTRQAEAEQTLRLEEDPWTPILAAYAAGRQQTTTRALMDLLDVPEDRRTGGHAKRVGGIMRRLGWARHIDQASGNREAIWFREPCK